MPTIAEACLRLGVSQKIFTKWLKRVNAFRQEDGKPPIKWVKHRYDMRFHTITEDELQEIADARSQMPTKPVAPPVAPRTPTPTLPLSPALLRPSAPPRPYSMRHEPEGGAHFKTNADAARWLTLHADISESTPKGWEGWRDVELTKEAVLRVALVNEDLYNHRKPWRLHPCGDARCPCQTRLPGGHPAED